MSGAVSWEVLIWVVCLILGAGAAVAGFLFWVWRIVVGFNRALDERDSAAQLEKERAKMVEEELRRELSEYRVYAAEKYATKDGVTQAIDRMESAVERLASQVHDAVERLTSRLDRMLEREPGSKGAGR